MLVHLAVILVANQLDLGDATAIASTHDTCSFGGCIPFQITWGMPSHHIPLHYTTNCEKYGESSPTQTWTPCAVERGYYPVGSYKAVLWITVRRRAWRVRWESSGTRCRITYAAYSLTAVYLN
jgi:hypothetical protein